MNWVNPYTIKGIKVKTSKTDRFPISQLKLVRYGNGTFSEFGPADQGTLTDRTVGPANPTPAPRSSMDFSLTPEQELIRSSAREFCEREIVPHARDWDRAEELDRGLVAKLAAAGYLGATIAEDYGGMGLDTVSYCLLMEELGRADSSVRGIVSVNLGLVGKTIAKWGTDEQQARVAAAARVG